MTPQEYIQRLYEVSYKKLELLKAVLELTRAQSGSINGEGLENLSKLVDEKQVQIDAINKMDEEFEVYFRRLKSELKVKSLDQLKGTGLRGVSELQQVIGQIMDIIREISGIEKQNNERAASLLGKFSDEIKKINQGKKVSNAYMSGPSETPSYFIDKKK